MSYYYLMNEINAKSIYVTREVRKLLRIGELKIINLVHSGELVASRAGNKFIFLGSDLLKYLESTRVVKNVGKISDYSHD